MNLAVLIPDRNDRPEFLKNCLRMMQVQTLKPVHVEVMNDPAKSNTCDITRRYRIGYDRLRNKGFDLIALIENDDWYSPEYLQTMVNHWLSKNKPDIAGTNYTIYYHLQLHRYFKMEHYSRASAMNTLLKPDLSFNWCVDHEPYTDIHLWKTLKGLPFKPEKIISIGMKHGVGLCGGRSHVDRLHRYKEDGKELLKNTLDKESYKFYCKLHDTFEC